MKKPKIGWDRVEEIVVVVGIYAMIFFLVGCRNGELIIPERTFSGSITINQSNGDIQSVEVDFPNSVTLNNRKDLSNLLEEVKALVVEMESARDRMKVEEPKVK